MNSKKHIFRGEVALISGTSRNHIDGPEKAFCPIVSV